MIRSMMLVLAVAAGAAGCVAQDDATATTSQNTGVGLFNCQNNHSISVVQCVSLPITINANNVANVLDGNKINILNDDLNDLNISDINILNKNSVLSDLVDVTKNDFLNKFNVANVGDICAQVTLLNILGLEQLFQVCK